MAGSDTEVVIVGGGAAGIAAARRLHEARIRYLLVEARDRLGGRGWTVDGGHGFPLDFGCGWLHSADRNPWRGIAETQGARIDRTPPPWSKPFNQPGFPPEEQALFAEALDAFRERADSLDETSPDLPASAFLEAGSRWNPILDAISTYFSGAELDRVSARDLSRYDDDGVNWRVVEGYGATIAAHGAGLDVALSTPVRRIDHGGRRLVVETARGEITADAAIVAVPSSLIAEEGIVFTPGLPQKVEAASGLPLGLADKLFLSLVDPEEFETDSRLFGRIDRTGTGTYHVRPFGRPEIEVYFGGRLAAELEAGGERAFFDFAVEELVGILGSDFAARVAPIGHHGWLNDPYARGSYSYALPGRADDRAVLAAPVEDRLFFAGEACSRHDYSTAHGAYRTGVAAAEQAIAALKKG